MYPLEAMVAALKNFENSVDDIVMELAMEREETIIKMNVDNQMFRGFDATGKKIAPPYGPSTIKAKKRKRQPTNRVTLRDTGEFHASFFVHFERGFFQLAADDAKTRYLVQRYGADIFGLTEQNIIKLARSMKAEFVERAKQKILR